MAGYEDAIQQFMQMMAQGQGQPQGGVGGMIANQMAQQGSTGPQGGGGMPPGGMTPKPPMPTSMPPTGGIPPGGGMMMDPAGRQAIDAGNAGGATPSPSMGGLFEQAMNPQQAGGAPPMPPMPPDGAPQNDTLGMASGAQQAPNPNVLQGGAGMSSSAATMPGPFLKMLLQALGANPDQPSMIGNVRSQYAMPEVR